MWDKKDGGVMFREIVQFKRDRNITGFSIMQVVLMYCDEMDKDIDEVGDLLRKDKSFKETLQADLKFNHEAKFEDDKKYNKMSEWL